MYFSLLALLVCAVQDTGLIGEAAVIVWLAAFAVLTALNLGAAFGVYIASVGLFAVLRYKGWGTVFERPDNYALLILLGGLVLRIAASRSARLWNKTTILVGAFIGYGILEMMWFGLLTRGNFAWYMRMFGLPFLMFTLLEQCGLGPREYRALVRSLLVLGAYMSLISIAERIGWRELIMPTWITDPSVAAVDPSFGDSSGRSGGLLMQPEWNGLALSLIYCLAIGSGRVFEGTGLLLGRTVAVLCLMGVYFSYTRAAWLGCVVASMFFFVRPERGASQMLLRRIGVLAAGATLLVSLIIAPDNMARQRAGDSGTVFYRLNLWTAGLGMIARRPLLGSGFGTFGGNLADYQGVMTVGSKMKILDEPAHNTPLSVMAEMGAIGLSMYMAILGLVLLRMRAAALLKWGNEGAAWVTLFFAVYVVEVQFVIAHEPTTNQIFFGIAGIIAGFAIRAPSLRPLPDDPSNRPSATDTAFPQSAGVRFHTALS